MFKLSPGCLKICLDIEDWLEKSVQLKIKTNGSTYTTNFVPHSLTTSSSSVNIYLQELLRKSVVNNLNVTNYKIFRFMDDMVILSPSKETCQAVYDKIKSTIKLSEDKTKHSAAGEYFSSGIKYNVTLLNR